MSFTSNVKIEITKNKVNANCLRSLLSAFLRTAGTVESKNGVFGFCCQGEKEVLLYIAKCIDRAYKKDAVLIAEGTKKEHSKQKLVCDDSLDILVELGILRVEDGLEVILNIDNNLVDNEHMYRAYLAGAFLGSGSVTVPNVKTVSKTRYHLEFVFSKYITANDFCSVLAEHDLFPKLVERKDKFVVYFKSVEEVQSVLALCGANNSYLDLVNLQITKTIRNKQNRLQNCEMSNLSKAIDAGLKQREEINAINEVIGLDTLPRELYVVAIARLENESASYSELSEIVGISKSCLVHRLKKLSQIAKSL